jgi:hypothetical protein
MNAGVGGDALRAFGWRVFRPADTLCVRRSAGHWLLLISAPLLSQRHDRHSAAVRERALRSTGAPAQKPSGKECEW